MNLFYFRYTLLSAAKRPSCQAISEVICAGSSVGAPVISNDSEFNSSIIPDLTEVSEVDGKEIFDQGTKEVEELGKEDLALKVMKEDPGTSNCLTNFYCLV